MDALLFVALAGLLGGIGQAQHDASLGRSPSREREVSRLGYFLNTEEGKAILESEYQSIPGGQRRPWTVARRPENLKKNRYEDELLAYDDTRVVLEPIPGDPSSDYINANYITGYNSEREYVATQGPLPNTINDFWRMIWQLNVTKIIMLANLFEHGKPKVSKYWPDTTATYGDITVSKLSEHEFPQFQHAVRTLLVRKRGISEPRIVRHFHFTGWPDFGVPSDTLSLMSLVKQARAFNPDSRAPIVVHCSAGIGRTGTTIMTDSMIQKAEREHRVDFLKRLDQMRLQRPDVVEKKEQYVFGHQAVFDIFNGSRTEAYMRDVEIEYRKIDRNGIQGQKDPNQDRSPSREREVSRLSYFLNTDEGKSILESEYASIPGGQRKPWTVARRPENLKKNRYEDELLAFDDTRVVLEPIPGDPSSDYINANYITGYNYDREYVATQGPLPNTINDFWRMIWQINASKIIMLANLFEHGQPKVSKYWPDTTATYGDITVTKISEHEFPQFQHAVRTLSVRKRGIAEPRTVRHFHFTGWPDFGVPSDTLSLMSLVKQARAFRPDSRAPIVVHCSAGIGRTGTTIMTDSMIQKAERERRVDFLKRLDQMRLQRPDVVEKKEQYVFGHQAVFDIFNGNRTQAYMRDVDHEYRKIDSHHPREDPSHDRSPSHEREVSRLGYFLNTNEGKAILESEYASIPGGQRKPWTVARRPENLKKNRYEDELLAFDDTRVVLEPIPGDPSSDYINANYITGYNHDREYVATQGPLPNTINDFWRMIWQLNATKIIMLANLFEHGQPKVSKYWPDTTATYGDITVTKISEHEFPQFQHAVRTLSVRKRGIAEPRTVRHFHFTGWPDFGVPADTLSLMSLVKQARAFRPDSRAPIVVHCSAGIGRTGTTIMTDSMIQKAERERRVDFLKRLDQMRLQRPDVVEKKEQYVFGHQAVFDIFNGNRTQAYMRDVEHEYRKIDSHHTREDPSHDRSPSREREVSRLGYFLNTNEGKAILESEYASIPGGQRKPWTVARRPENLKKNRYEDELLAFDDTRVVLEPIPGDPSSDYINANYITGYNHDREYVATQGPLPNTINDFWRMIWQINATKIIMLANLFEHGQPKVSKYWPDTTATYGDITVTKISEHEFPQFQHAVRTLSVRKRGIAEPRTVRHFHFTGWPDFGVPSDTLSLMSLVKQARAFRPDSRAPIVVHCSAGIGRTGTTIMTDSMIQKAERERRVDFLKRLDQMRLQRPDVVEKKEQYVFGHQAVFDIFNGNRTHAYMRDVEHEYRKIDGHHPRETKQPLIDPSHDRSPSREREVARLDYFLTTNEGRAILESEYASIPGGQRKPWTVARRPENLKKNRYEDELLAFDDTRVVLEPIPGDPSSDYINANYITGYNYDREYVATQGPLPNTINDFWRMIWQINASKIIMLANLFEHGKPKVSKYWPDTSATYGDITVAMISEHEFPQFQHVVRTLSVRKRGIKQPRIVRHFHFTGWPDFGVPSDTLSLMSLVKQARAYKPDSRAPIVVHCSAGIGRTGTTIMTDSMIQKAEREYRVDFLKRLDQMRLQRPDVVEKKEQYVFGHQAVFDIFNGSRTEAYMRDVENEYRKIDNPVYTDVYTVPQNMQEAVQRLKWHNSMLTLLIDYVEGKNEKLPSAGGHHNHGIRAL